MNHFDKTQLAVSAGVITRRTQTHATYRRIAVSVAALHSSFEKPPVQLLPLPPPPQNKTCAANSTTLHSAARDVRLPCRHL